MSDIALTWDAINFEGAMALKGGDLDTDPQQELATAVITSIFTWARAQGQGGIKIRQHAVENRRQGGALEPRHIRHESPPIVLQSEVAPTHQKTDES